MAINIDDYLKDINAENVCGDDLEYDPKFAELEQAIKGKPETQFTEGEPPNWRDVKKQSEALLSRTIDLRVLISYVRALIALEGFSGLEDGLILLTTLVEKRWDSIHPQLDPEDDNDPETRINILLSLCDNETFLRPLQKTPLLESKALGRFNFRDFSIAYGKSTATANEEEVTQSTIEGAIQDVETEALQQTLQAITVSLENINQLESTVTDYVGINKAPSFADLRLFLKDSIAYLKAALETKGVGADSNAEVSMDENISTANTPATGVEKSVMGVINNNQDVIKTLNLVCDYYKKHEPSSPVPFFIERALRLVGKNFMDAIKDIAPAGIDDARLILGMRHEEDE